MDYQKIAKTLLTVTNGNAQIQNVFESTFRENVASLDLQILASGSIPHNIISNCIASALQKAANEANTLALSTVSAQIWNPLTAILLRESARPVPVPLKSKFASSNTKREKITLAKASDTVSDNISKDDIRKIHLALQQNKPTSGIYNNSFHSHISCVKPQCQFCMDLFQQVNISKCVGHKPCHASGHYPHVGKTLWKMIKGRHDRGDQCKLKDQICKKGYLPSLLTDLRLCEQPEESDWNNLMDDVPPSPVYYPTVNFSPKRARRYSESSQSTIC